MTIINKPLSSCRCLAPAPPLRVVLLFRAICLPRSSSFVVTVTVAVMDNVCTMGGVYNTLTRSVTLPSRSPSFVRSSSCVKYIKVHCRHSLPPSLSFCPRRSLRRGRSGRKRRTATVARRGSPPAYLFLPAAASFAPAARPESVCLWLMSGPRFLCGIGDLRRGYRAPRRHFRSAPDQETRPSSARLLYQFNSCGGGGAAGETGAFGSGRRSHAPAPAWGESGRRGGR